MLPQGNSHIAPEHIHCRRLVQSAGAGIQRRSDKLQLCDCERTSRSGRTPQAYACAGAVSKDSP
jgi:hypothetical protein